MKSINYLFVCIVLLSIFLNSCDKTERLQERYQDMIKCHSEEGMDSLKINEALLGEWSWEYIYCYTDAEGANGKDFEDLTIEFKSDNTLEVKEDGQITQTATWELSRTFTIYFSLFGFETTPRIVQTSGLVVFCGNKLLFHQSDVDACDNYFKRKD